MNARVLVGLLVAIVPFVGLGMVPVPVDPALLVKLDLFTSFCTDPVAAAARRLETLVYAGRLDMLASNRQASPVPGNVPGIQLYLSVNSHTTTPTHFAIAKQAPTTLT